MLNRIKKNKDKNFFLSIKDKKKIFKSKVNHALYTEHEHFFSKKEVLDFRQKKKLNIINKSSKFIADPKCVICGLGLTEYQAHIRYETMEIPSYKG